MIAPGAATVMWMRHRRATIRREVKHQLIAGLENDQLEVLKFAINETSSLLKWKHSREFEYNHHMYDIVETKVEGDTIYYWCWWDYEETILNKKLNHLLANAFNHDPQRKEKQSSLLHFFKSFFLPQINTTGKEQTKPLVFSVDYEFVVKSIDIFPPSPPPRLAA